MVREKEGATSTKGAGMKNLWHFLVMPRTDVAPENYRRRMQKRICKTSLLKWDVIVKF
jgi:hypothetical protein